MLKEIDFENFTVFEKAKIEFSPGINVFIGENGTGKTHVLKALYAACTAPPVEGDFIRTLRDVFFTSPDTMDSPLEKLWRIGADGPLCLRISRFDGEDLQYREDGKVGGGPCQCNSLDWFKTTPSLHGIYIPCKNLMENARGFCALCAVRELAFERVYPDIINELSLPQVQNRREKLAEIIQRLENVIGGEVRQDPFSGEFEMRVGDESMPYSLVAEGYQKFGLLLTLLKNIRFDRHPVLFWDEPESHFNPKMIPLLVETLLEFQRQGAQIFIATHDYILAKYFELECQQEHQLRYFSLYKDATRHNSVQCQSCDNFRDLTPNPLIEAFDTLLDKVYNLSMGD